MVALALVARSATGEASVVRLLLSVGESTVVAIIIAYLCLLWLLMNESGCFER